MRFNVRNWDFEDIRRTWHESMGGYAGIASNFAGRRGTRCLLAALRAVIFNGYGTNPSDAVGKTEAKKDFNKQGKFSSIIASE